MKKAQDRAANIQRISELDEKEKVDFLLMFYKHKATPNEMAKKYQCTPNTVNQFIVGFSKDKSIMTLVRMRLGKRRFLVDYKND